MWDQPIEDSMSRQIFFEQVLAIPAPEGAIQVGEARKDMKFAENHKLGSSKGGRNKAYSPEKRAKMAEKFSRAFTEFRARHPNITSDIEVCDRIAPNFNKENGQPYESGSAIYKVLKREGILPSK